MSVRFVVGRGIWFWNFFIRGGLGTVVLLEGVLGFKIVFIWKIWIVFLGVGLVGFDGNYGEIKVF